MSGRLIQPPKHDVRIGSQGLPTIPGKKELPISSLKDPDSLTPLLVSFPPEDMIAFPVSPRVNAPSTDDVGCIAPLP